MSWWDEERWQQEIDFMALNGINMPLALTGQNSVWKRVYNKLGFSDSELESFFSGPAYYNWFWMGNLDGWGGPLPQSCMKKQEKLAKENTLRRAFTRNDPGSSGIHRTRAAGIQGQIPGGKNQHRLLGEFSGGFSSRPG